MPFNILDAQIVNQLRKFSAVAEEAGELVPDQLSIIYDKKWFKLFVSEKFGGHEMTLPEGLRLEEDIARIDGSLGWTVTLCAGANLFVGFIDPVLAKEYFYDEKVCLGGSGIVSGTADVLEDGLLINGHWKYVTGEPHLSHFTVNCRLMKAGVYLNDENGVPLVRSFIFKKEEVAVSKDWNTMGLKATASNSFTVNNLKVDKNRMFIIAPEHSTINSALYHYPFLQFAETTLAVNTLGMAKHFLEEARHIAAQRLQSGRTNQEGYDTTINRINFAQNFMDKNKENFYAKVDRSWQQLTEHNLIEPELLQSISFLSKGMAKASRELLMEVYPRCGLAATENGSAINRIFRDIFTGSQHSLLAV
ncbi:MAG: hypothetical protein BGN92_01465 [Sphingobacteriales bacterium 41-5]|nr:MAG: hypothetical protein BGN92_01465 [Sphingobacteriales bacterium 41-5]